MVLDESDTDWNDSEEMSNSEDLANSLIEAQEDTVDPLQVYPAQDIFSDDDNNEPETIAHLITTSITSRIPSTSNTSGPTVLTTPSFVHACQQPSTSSNVPELSNRRVPIPFAQCSYNGPCVVGDFKRQLAGILNISHLRHSPNATSLSAHSAKFPPSATGLKGKMASWIISRF